MTQYRYHQRLTGAEIYVGPELPRSMAGATVTRQEWIPAQDPNDWPPGQWGPDVKIDETKHTQHG